ncbi:MAG TPA: hypothetical protein VKT52_12350 [Ktedonobacterales bacterium]|nr:hypothetical protein [Ktedonobacterales bacterium]
MDDQPGQPPDVADEVEVSDLRDEPATAPAHEYDIPRRPLTRRQRGQRLAVASGSVLLALLILITAVPGLRAGAGSWLAGFVPTPTATLPAGTDRFYFIASVPDIQLSIDGRSVALPRIGTDPPLALARGQHRLSWKAAPFLPQSCLVSVPFGLNDTCGTPIPVRISTSKLSVTASIMLLRESLATLPSSQQSAVAAAIQHALPNSTSAIQPGDHYALAQVATQPLRGTLVFQLDTTNASGTADGCALSSQPPYVSPYVVCNFVSNPCAVCTIPASVLASAGVTVAPSSWYVVTYATLSFTISTLSGQTLVANSPISQGELAIADYAILIALTWDGTAWHAQPFLGEAYDALLQRLNASSAFAAPPFLLSPYFADIGCAAMSDFIGPNAFINDYRNASFVAGPNPSDGCLAIVTVATASGTQKAYYLYRLGELVAVNDLAHRQAPVYPVASAHERQIAAAILASGTTV